MEAYATLLASCEESGTDPAIVAFVALDTCGSKSPIRGCTPGAHLFNEVMADALKIEAVDSAGLAKELRDEVRRDLWNGGQMMQRSMQKVLAHLKPNASATWQRGRDFLHDVVGESCVGTDVYRDKALTALRMSYTKAGCVPWQEVQFPIVFHLQWTPELTPTGKPKMLFHVTFEPWKTAMGLALALCGPCPPIQVARTRLACARARVSDA